MTGRTSECPDQLHDRAYKCTKQAVKVTECNGWLERPVYVLLRYRGPGANFRSIDLNCAVPQKYLCVLKASCAKLPITRRNTNAIYAKCSQLPFEECFRALPTH